MEQPDKLPLEYRLAQNKKIEAERKAWHQRKREESDKWREAYEFLEAQEKHISDQMAQAFQSMNTVTNQLAQCSAPQPLRQEPEPTIPQPLRQEPDPLQQSIFLRIACPDVHRHRGDAESSPAHGTMQGDIRCRHGFPSAYVPD